MKKGTKEVLIRDLRAALPQIRSTRPTIEGKRIYVLSGIRIGLDATVAETPDTLDKEFLVRACPKTRTRIWLNQAIGPGVSRVETIVASSRSGHEVAR